MFKTIVHIVKVKRKGEKIQFQIKLPLNIKQVSEIRLTANPVYQLGAGSPDKFAKEVGWLWLRIPESRDVFYYESLKLSIPNHHQTLPAILSPIYFETGQHWISGKKNEAFKIEAKLNTNMMEGYYIDRIYSEENYQVRIYLTLKI